MLMEISTQPGPDKELSALTCSALLSLVVALGDTGKLLTAVMAMLMAPGSLSSQEIMVSTVFTKGCDGHVNSSWILIITKNCGKLGLIITRNCG